VQFDNKVVKPHKPGYDSAADATAGNGRDSSDTQQPDVCTFDATSDVRSIRSPCSTSSLTLRTPGLQPRTADMKVDTRTIKSLETGLCSHEHMMITPMTDDDLSSATTTEHYYRPQPTRRN